MSRHSDGGLASRSAAGKVRLDRWLWAARFFKTRAQAKQAIEGGKVHYNEQRSKPAREVELGATLDITRGVEALTVVVEGLSQRRGPAPEAQRLYRETELSIARGVESRESRRLHNAGFQRPTGKPDKRNRRVLSDLKHQSPLDPHDPALEPPPSGSEER